MEEEEFSANLDLKNEEEFLDALNHTLNPLRHTLEKFVAKVPEALTCLLDRDVEPESSLPSNDGKKSREPSRSSLKRAAPIEDDDDGESPLRAECEMLRGQLRSQQEELRRAREEIERLKNQTLNQGTFCASLGAVLGNLAWSSSKIPEVVDVWLSRFQEKVSAFLTIACGSFAAFVNTYETDFPPSSNVEYQFVMGLLGIATNISASPEGRQYMIVHPNGGDLVRSVIEFMPKITLSSGSLPLQRLLAMILYNVSMNKSGLRCLLSSRVGDALSRCLRDDAMPGELRTLYLRVLQSVTYDLTDPEYARDVLASVPLEMLEDIAARSEQDELRAVANDVIRQLRAMRKEPAN